MAEKVVIGNAELWHGDCREVLPLLPECDLILTDPPYGIGFAAQPTRYQRANGIVATAWDDQTPPSWVFGLLLEKAKNAIVWGGNYYALPAIAGIKPCRHHRCDLSERRRENERIRRAGRDRT